jgi:excisionase family DNA binding protein
VTIPLRGATRGERTTVPELLDQHHLAERLQITERHVRRLVAERRIPFVKVGRFVRFDPVAVAAWLDRWTTDALR